MTVVHAEPKAAGDARCVVGVVKRKSERSGRTFWSGVVNGSETVRGVLPPKISALKRRRFTVLRRWRSTRRMMIVAIMPRKMPPMRPTTMSRVCVLEALVVEEVVEAATMEMAVVVLVEEVAVVLEDGEAVEDLSSIAQRPFWHV